MLGQSFNNSLRCAVWEDSFLSLCCSEPRIITHSTTAPMPPPHRQTDTPKIPISCTERMNLGDNNALNTRKKHYSAIKHSVTLISSRHLSQSVLLKFAVSTWLRRVPLRTLHYSETYEWTFTGYNRCFKHEASFRTLSDTSHLKLVMELLCKCTSNYTSQVN